jgi:DNA polymerase-3 subunit gamma/tau
VYQVIARKYRPQTFRQVVNQQHVKQTLENAVAKGRVAHGYIFAGQRGTGKTTVARILAKCLNCVKGPTITPDLECPSCREIAASSSMDVIEIDAASNRGIDDVRELREAVRYRPSRDRYKVFIIDEAHQITDAAFNALLKTLEEPPEWVVFMLCTTEAHKIPPTIVSRCQNFTFQMVDFDHVVAHLQWICEQEGIEAEADALSVIALAGDGSIRDSLSTLDQAIASFGKTLHAADVRDLLGAVSSEVLDEFAAALRDQSPAGMLELVEKLTARGQNPQHFCRDLTRFIRNLMVARMMGADSRLIAASADERRRLDALASQFSEEDLTRHLQLALNLYRDLQHAPHPRFHLEMGLLKLVYAGKMVDLEKALAAASSDPQPPAHAPGDAQGPTRGSSTRSRSAAPPPAPGGGRMQAAQPAGTAAVAKRNPPAASPAGAETATGAQPGATASPQDDFRSRLLEALRAEGHEFTADAVEHSAIDLAGGDVHFLAPPDLQFSLESASQLLNEISGRLLGRRARIRVTLADTTIPPRNVSEGAPTRAGTQESGASGDYGPAGERALAHPQVQKFLATFGGQIRQVRDLKET